MSIYDFSATSATANGTTDGDTIAEGATPPSAVNNSLRNLKWRIGEFVDDLGGVNTVGGTADAVTITSAASFASYADGVIITWKASGTNTTAMTVNVTPNGGSALGIKKIRMQGDTAVPASSVVANGRYSAIFDAAYDSAAGAFVLLNPTPIRRIDYFPVAVSDETTTITTGTAKVTFRMPAAFTLTAVRASLSTASSSGLPTFDINEGGVTILSTKLSIDANEKTSTTAATPAVISDANLADDAEITVDIDVAGAGAKGAKIYLIGYWG